MLPIVVSVDGTLPVWEPPGESEDEVLVPADRKFEGGASYVILNLIDGKRYEGESVCFKDRYKAHMRTMKNENVVGHEYYLYRAMRKHGIENFRFYFRQTFVFEAREKLNPDDRKAFYKKFKAAYLHPCETYWIRRLGLMDDSKGYNQMESGEGGAGRVWTEEEKAKVSASMIGHTHSPTKPVTRCEILEDGDMYQKVRLTRYESAAAAERANPGANQANISACCLKKKKSAGGYLWWFCKEDDVYDEDITVERVGNLPGTSHFKAIISVLKLANGDYLEQWHAGMGKAGRTLSTADKKVDHSSISKCCRGERKSCQGYNFRRVTTEKREDFPDGKRTVKYAPERYITKKRKRKNEF